MKKKFLTFALCAFATYSAFAQAPQKFNYQGVARTSTGSAIANQSIGLRISILDGSSSGTAQYVETQNVTTNALGLYNLAIGGGTVTSGSWANITWGSGNKYIKIEADATGGTSYTTLGTSQLLSVPYALYAANASAGSASGTKNYVGKFTSASAIGNSSIYDSLGKVGIGTITPSATLHIKSTSDSMLQRLNSTYTGTMANGIQRIEYTGSSTLAAGSIIDVEPTATAATNAVGILSFANNTGIIARAADPLVSTTAENIGLMGQSYSQGTAVGVYGGASNYTGTTAGTKYGVYGDADPFGGSTNYAGYFNGNVAVNGSISKLSGTFKIDNPLDPANQYLYHSFVESPDMMNVYNGNITTDGNGKATVTLPDYFEALNKDFRYQLTVIGTFAQAIVAEKVNGNKFVIKTNQPNVEVSWQVTGIRQDAYANAHRVVPVVEKEAENKGKYLSPVELGKDASLQIGKLNVPQNKTATLTPVPQRK